MSDPLHVRLEGPAPVMGVAVDMARRSLWLLPVILVLSLVFWGVPGVLSTLYALAIVVVNFLLSAYTLAVTGRINAALMAGAAMFGFLVRLGIIVAAVLLVINAWWVAVVPLCITLVVTHLVLLFWEMRYISGSLAFPGVKPGATPNPFMPGNADTSSAPSAPSAQNAQ